MKKKLLLILFVIMLFGFLFWTTEKDNNFTLFDFGKEEQSDSPIAKHFLTKGDFLVLKRDIIIPGNSIRTVVESGECVFIFQYQAYPKTRVIMKGDKLKLGDVRPDLTPTKPGVRVVRKFDFYCPCWVVGKGPVPRDLEETATFLGMSVSADNGSRSPTLADFEELFVVSRVIERFR